MNVSPEVSLTVHHPIYFDAADFGESKMMDALSLLTTSEIIVGLSELRNRYLVVEIQ